ncbi:MAG: TolC family protein [Gemmatimonadota bacterium]
MRAIATAFLTVFAAAALPVRPAPAAPPAREITVRECVAAALLNNVEIAVSRDEKGIGDLGVPIEEAAFLPKFTGELSYSRTLMASSSAITGTLAVGQTLYKADLGAEALLRTGARLSLSFENQRQETDSFIALRSPEYTTALTLSAQQPLLRNRGTRVTLAPIGIARAGAAEKTAEWKAKVMDVVAAARIAFFALVAADREVEVRRGAVTLAERLLQQVDARIDAGTAAPIDRLPAVATAAARTEELLRAQAAAQGAQDDLKRILGARSEREWEERLLAVPGAGDIAPPGEDETVTAAMKRRPEVRAQAARETQADLRELLARSRVRPSLDLSVSGGFSGLAGTPRESPFVPAGTTIAFEGNYRDSLREMVSGRYYNWFLGLKTEIPWRLERERAEWARARTNVDIQRLAAEGVATSVRTEVHKARRDLESALARIDAARLSAEAAKRKLDAEEAKLSVGRSTVPQVLQFQQDYSEALLSEVRARGDAQAAQTRLRRAVGSILDEEGIVLR